MECRSIYRPLSYPFRNFLCFINKIFVHILYTFFYGRGLLIHTLGMEQLCFKIIIYKFVDIEMSKNLQKFFLKGKLHSYVRTQKFMFIIVRCGVSSFPCKFSIPPTKIVKMLLLPQWLFLYMYVYNCLFWSVYRALNPSSLFLR